MFSNHVYKIIILLTLVIRIHNLEIFLFCQHNSTGGGNLELRQTICIPIVCKYFFFVVSMETREKNQSHVAVGYFR
jgi:hypothetical protein